MIHGSKNLGILLRHTIYIDDLTSNGVQGIDYSDFDNFLSRRID